MAREKSKLTMEEVIDAVAKVQDARAFLQDIAGKFADIPRFGKLIRKKVNGAEKILEELEDLIKRLPGKVKY